MSVPGFDAAQARYDGATPPEPFECDLDCESRGRDCDCEQDALDAYEDLRDSALIARDDAERGR